MNELFTPFFQNKLFKFTESFAENIKIRRYLQVKVYASIVRLLDYGSRASRTGDRKTIEEILTRGAIPF